MQERRYVSTGRDGRSRTATGEVVWDLPAPAGPGAAAGGPLVLRSLDGLLDDLGERVFVAEAVGEAPEGAGPLLEVGSARLVEETAWDDTRAARFALECAAHALGDEGGVALPHGYSLAGVLDDVRSALERAEAPQGALGFLARAATLRRLRREGAAVSDLAMLAAKEDEKAGIDLFDDPAWTQLAAISEAVLAAVEALRYLAHPEHVRRQEELAEQGAEDVSAAIQVEETPWGWVAVGAERVPTAIPAATCAEQAAERARQAVADMAGEEAARAERAWQAALLGSLLDAAG